MCKSLYCTECFLNNEILWHLYLQLGDCNSQLKKITDYLDAIKVRVKKIFYSLFVFGIILLGAVPSIQAILIYVGALMRTRKFWFLQVLRCPFFQRKQVGEHIPSYMWSTSSTWRGQPINADLYMQLGKHEPVSQGAKCACFNFFSVLLWQTGQKQFKAVYHVTHDHVFPHSSENE